MPILSLDAKAMVQEYSVGLQNIVRFWRIIDVLSIPHIHMYTISRQYISITRNDRFADGYATSALLVSLKVLDHYGQ